MRKRAKGLFALLLLLAAASAGWIFLFRPGTQGGTVARITLDGAVVEEIDLAALTLPRTFVVTGESGLTNTISIQPGKIRVEAADCPDQICVHQGYISDGTTPIVCLPNKLIIEIVGGGNDLDAAAG